MTMISRYSLVLFLVALVSASTGLGAEAADVSGWRFVQDVRVPSSGLHRIRLEPETLDASAAGLSDLRLAGPEGFLPVLVERRADPPGKETVKDLPVETSLLQGRTVALAEVAELSEPVSSITLVTPGRAFLKSVTVESLNVAGGAWMELVADRMVFRQGDGSEDLTIPLPVHRPAALRVTLTDSGSSPPVPVTSLRVALVPAEDPDQAAQAVTVERREEYPKATRLTCDFGAANVFVESVRIDCADPVFAAGLKLLVPMPGEREVEEEVLASGGIMRVAGVGPGSKGDRGVVVPVRRMLSSRRAVIMIDHGGGVPLSGVAVSAVFRPADLWFSTPQAGDFQLLAGNPEAAAPGYDTRALQVSSRQSESIATLKGGPMQVNPHFVQPAAPVALSVMGGALVADDWGQQRRVQLKATGVQELELDPAALAAIRPGLEDLRLVSGGRQIPWLVERPDVSKAVEIGMEALPMDAKRAVSQWVLNLPQAGIPFRELRFFCNDALFQRRVVLREYREGVAGGGGMVLASADWVRRPGDPIRPLTIPLNRQPVGSTLILEMDDQGNRALHFVKAEGLYPLVRVIFAAPEEGGVMLLSGNGRVAAPVYDVRLMARELLRAPRSSALLEAALTVPPVALAGGLGPGPIWLWMVLAAVALLLVWVISRLLPQGPGESEEGGE